MIPVLNASQTREADKYTIENEPIKSIDLMERASAAFLSKFLELTSHDRKVAVITGVGNNGGDGLAIARMLVRERREVKVYFVGKLEKSSPDFKINFDRLAEQIEVNQLKEISDIPKLSKDQVIIEGLFGSGLSRPVSGFYADVISAINDSGAQVFSIDIPSGLYADKSAPDGAIIQANHTITFQTPKLTFFQPSMHRYVGKWHVVDIGLDKGFVKSIESVYYLTEKIDLKLPQRNHFAHKGDAGRLMLVVGSKGKMGAATLTARAAMRAGCGLLFVHTPCCGLEILQINVPEAMVEVDEHTEVISEVNLPENMKVVAAGPGLGTSQLTQRALGDMILNADHPMVLDADALNILAMNKHLLEALPSQSVLTPHPGEFRRLVGDWHDDFEKLAKLQDFCRTYLLNVVLKGAYSVICDAKGTIFFNPSGNLGMATGGSGDVLTGVVSALMAQGVAPFAALQTGVFIHGVAGDLAVKKVGTTSLIASDIIEYLPAAFMTMA